MMPFILAHQALLLSIVEQLTCSALSLVTLRERLRRPLPECLAYAVLLTGLQPLAYRVHPLLVYGFIPLCYGLLCLLIRARPAKVLLVFAITLNYLYVIHAGWAVLHEGSLEALAPLLTLLLLLLSLPWITYLLQKRVWPVLNVLQQTAVRIMLPIPISFSCIFILISISYLGDFSHQEALYIALIALTAFAAFHAYSLILRLLRLNEDEALVRQNLQHMDLRLASQAERYRRISAQIEETRRMRHDLRQHTRLLSELLREGHTQEALRYLEDYAGTQAGGEEPLSAHPMVDALLRHYLRRAGGQQTALQLRVGLPPEVRLPDTDLSIVLGNLLENALEACARQREGERFIQVQVRRAEPEVLIAISNSFDPELERQRERQRRRQGLGIPSVHAIARSHGGLADFTWEDGVFRASVLLYEDPAPAGGMDKEAQ